LLILLGRTAILRQYGGWAVEINYFIVIALGANTGIQEEIKNDRIAKFAAYKRGCRVCRTVRARHGFGGLP
jgi:hypothetical protein